MEDLSIRKWVTFYKHTNKVPYGMLRGEGAAAAVAMAEHAHEAVSHSLAIQLAA